MVISYLEACVPTSLRAWDGVSRNPYMWFEEGHEACLERLWMAINGLMMHDERQEEANGWAECRSCRYEVAASVGIAGRRLREAFCVTQTRRLQDTDGLASQVEQEEQ